METLLVDSNVTGLCPHFNGANRWIVLFNAAIIINASTEVIQFVAYGVDAKRILLVNNILFE